MSIISPSGGGRPPHSFILILTLTLLCAYFAIENPEYRDDFMVFIAPIMLQALPKSEESDEDDDDDGDKPKR